uniref:Mce/MlaD domain-containing protein n=1 Tax=Leiomenia cribrosa TaxID=217483 RepID=A0A4D6WVE6_9FLOR|nr:hypothetical protein [Leiomenia cribrosa]
MISIIFVVVVWFMTNYNKNIQGYGIFIRFNNANGIKLGTDVRMRGVKIGHIKNLKIDINSILVFAHVYSTNIFIPKNSIVETNQTGLLNDSVIDIIPLEKLDNKSLMQIDVFSSKCINSQLICHLNCLEGDRGLNYDDLIRAATRISQRFDDPSFFNIFYLFLQNSIELSDDILNITIDISNLLALLYKSVYTNFSGN